MAIVEVWDDVYNSQELAIIWEALDKIQESGAWEGEETIGSSTLADGVVKRTGKAIWLTEKGESHLSEAVYPLEAVIAKLYSSYTGKYAEGGLWEQGILLTNSHAHLLSYYEDREKYDAHWDASPFTALTWFCKEPQVFSGGDLYFPQLNQTVPFKNNRLILFPGHVWHEVTPVHLPLEHQGKGLGRYCISQFLNTDAKKHATEQK